MWNWLLDSESRLLVSEKNFHIEVKVCSNLVRYFMLIVDRSILFCAKYEKKNILKKKIKWKVWQVFIFFYIKRPIRVNSHVYKVTN